jgi:KDO2-lipid IV(A) lauroyltransferase
MRERLNAIPVPMKKVYKEVLKYEKSKKPYILGMVADQSPPRREVNYWTTFMNQETAFFTGSEKIAKRFNHAIVFTVVHKVRRGHYEVEFTELFENASETGQNEITEAYVRSLEHVLQQKPEYWLWSHRRWKHKRKQRTH